MALQLFARLQSYLLPLFFIATAAYASLAVVFELLTFRITPKDAMSAEKLRARLFSKVWLMLKDRIFKMEEDSALPNLVAKASGTVIELGPGSGNQLSRYDVSRIDKIYGIEPTLELHDELRKNIKKQGLSDVYTIVPCGIEDEAMLSKYGLEPESADTITTVQVFCSVPKPKEMVKHLYRLLKPGGQLIAYEHVKSKDFVSARVQDIYNCVWPPLMGNCHLDRPTGEYLLDAGHWSSVELEGLKEQDPTLALPRVYGRLVK